MRLLVALILGAFFVTTNVSFSQTVTTEITVTNVPKTGFNFTFIGSFRIWTNATTATTITTNGVADVNQGATNLYNQISLNMFLDPTYGRYRIFRGATNSIKLLGPPGAVPTLSQNSNWISWTFTTNATQPGTNIAVPAAKVWLNASDRTNIHSQLQTDIVDYGSTGKAYPTNDARMVNFLGNDNRPQTAKGVLTLNQFHGTNTGTIYNGTETNTTRRGGTMDWGVLGTTAAPELHRVLIDDGSNDAILLKGSSGLTNAALKASDSGLVLTAGPTVSTPLDARAPDDPAVVLNYWTATRLFPHLATDSVTGTNQWNIINQWLGTANYFYEKLTATNGWFYGMFASNSIYAGTNQWTGDLGFSRFDNPSLANGNNAAILVGTNVNVNAYGPTAAYTLNGFQGGRDGKGFYFWKTNSLTMTVANDSGTDPTFGNRIYTGTGADVTLTNNPGCVQFQYNSALQHWCIVSKSN